MQRSAFLLLLAIAASAYLAGRLSGGLAPVKAASADVPTISVQPVRGDTSLTVYYPGLNKLFVYQTPFVGLPTWNCAYSIQLSTPGGKVERQPCPSAGQAFQ
ncbi:MAG: hypothetical protein ACJ74Y_14505 [Bryobacteraceae bacterium]